MGPVRALDLLCPLFFLPSLILFTRAFAAQPTLGEAVTFCCVGPVRAPWSGPRLNLEFALLWSDKPVKAQDGAAFKCLARQSFVIPNIYAGDMAT